MISLEYIIIISTFVVYYLAVLIKEKKIIRSPKKIIGKFLSIILLYAGISLLYYSITGNPFPGTTQDSYSLYIFVIGFVAILWTIPDLLEEFKFFRRFERKGEKEIEAATGKKISLKKKPILG